MNTVLDEIISNKKQEVKRRKQRGISELKEREMFFRATIPFRSALERTTLPIGVIAEIKHKSPSGGVLQPTFSPESIAEEYEENLATAISVLTDEHFFGGTLHHLESVRKCVSLPLLKKDFNIDAIQIYEAKSYGADAILFIADILTKSQLNELFFCALELGLESLIEVYDPHALEKIDFLITKLIGINNRNLKTMEVGLEHTELIAQFLPKDVCIISESGIRTAEDIRLVKKGGAKGILIGEHLMKAESPGLALKELIESCREK